MTSLRNFQGPQTASELTAEVRYEAPALERLPYNETTGDEYRGRNIERLLTEHSHEYENREVRTVHTSGPK